MGEEIAESGSHRSVLLREAVEALRVRPDGLYVDGTFGAGGHAREIFRELGPEGRLIVLDVDPGAVDLARRTFADAAGHVAAERENFARLPQVLDRLGIDCVDGVLLDLGWSSGQLAGGAKGLSFDSEEPLDMRLDPNLQVTAADLVNRLPEKELADTLYELADEHRSRAIARAIAAHRPFRTAKELAGAVEKATGGRRGARIHPATKTFQALRMRVNGEIQNLETVLEEIPRRLRPDGGRFAVITFHSGEDRRVKTAFRQLSAPTKDPRTGQIVAEAPYRTLRDIAPSKDEISRNSRARSARLRVLERRAVA